jgi:hypothetical protein
MADLQSENGIQNSCIVESRLVNGMWCRSLESLLCYAALRNWPYRISDCEFRMADLQSEDRIQDLLHCITKRISADYADYID